MSKVCGTCMFLDQNSYREHSYFGREWKTYRCTECGGYHEETDMACRYYKESIESKKSNQQSGCFITSIVVYTLGYNDDCIVLRTLRKFRNEILQPDPLKQNILLEYDVVGPLISCAIKNDPNNKMLCHSIMYNYLLPITKMIKYEKDNLKATACYTAMVMQLKNHYGLTIDTESYQYVNDVKQTDMGKGYFEFTQPLHGLTRNRIQQV
ncbi:MAG: hypothetical protein IJO33_02805 [Bacilli bacterium]|nr:hypothetical protein [Bacilli bacterium]